ncbi:helix-turn-helix domain-containing protein [Nocardiopsis lucentensis]|uniref:helix-turn-helix domain-containing protein n=1 Tax=Nocardiopsis lucentensis TaxID=53441 RepID=UPI000347DF77|nr:helix-turn-helix domain-containing protein [Nocardiopsis lucentensis]
MQSTVLHPCLEAETPDPVDSFACGPRRREKGALKGVGFIPVLWVARALREGLLPCCRTVPVALAIADAVDADGRWCFLSHETIVRRCGGTVSRSTVERALNDLAAAGLIRRLTRSQVRDFFAEDVTDGVRQADRLPGVLELLIPASAFAEPTLAEINEVRAGLDEDPLDAATRPYPRVGTTPQSEVPPVRSDVRDTSDRGTDPYPTHPSPSDPSPSVRRCEPGEAAAPPPGARPATPRRGG